MSQDRLQGGDVDVGIRADRVGAPSVTFSPRLPMFNVAP